MHFTRAFCLALLVASSAATAAADEDHFGLSVAGYRSHFDTTLRVDVPELSAGDSITLEHDLGFRTSDTLTRVDAWWRLSDRQRITLAYLDATRDSTRRLDRDVRFGDAEFHVDTTVKGRFRARGAEAIYRYRVWQGERAGLELGAGIHHMDLTASLAVSQAQLHETAQGSGPLPVLAGAFDYRIADDWRFLAEYQWLRARVNKLDGRLTEGRVGLEYLGVDRLSLGLYWSRLTLDLDLKKRRWTGHLDLDYSGPQVAAGVRF